MLSWNGSAWVNSSVAGSGATSLDELTDVNIGTPGAGQDGYVLSWDDAAGEFVLVAQSATGVSAFLDLADTPANFSGAGGYLVRVNAGGTALEFFQQSLSTADISDLDPGSTIGHVATWDGSKWASQAPTGGVSTLLGLSDTPGAFGAAGGFARVNGTANGLEFTTAALADLSNVAATAPTSGQVLAWNGSTWTPTTVAGASTTFAALTDTPGDFTGAANQFVRVNGTATALEYVAPALSNLSDVDTAGVAAGHLLLMGGASVFGTAAHTLGNVNDVDLTGLADGMALVYDSGTTTWTVQEALAVDTAGVLDGQVLAYDSGTQTWVPSSAGTSLYTADGALDSDRTLSGALSAFALSFNDIKRFSAAFGGTSATGDSILSLDNNGTILFKDRLAAGSKTALRVVDDLSYQGGNDAAVFHVKSLYKGAVPRPVMTEAQRDAIAAPINGLSVWVSDQNENHEYHWDGAAWRRVGAAYERVFNSGQWSANAITITAAVHLQGNAPRIVQVYEDTGTEYTQVLMDSITINKSTGDVTISHGGAGNFDGKLVISA